jgi:hypothetical protein
VLRIQRYGVSFCRFSIGLYRVFGVLAGMHLVIELKRCAPSSAEMRLSRV